MRIAIFSDTFYPQVNGVAAVAGLSARALAERGHEVAVFTVVAPANLELARTRAGGRVKVVNLPSLPFPGYPGERMALSFGFALLKIKRFRPDVIHVHTPMGVGWEAVFASTLFGIPLVGTHHTFFDHYLKYVKMDYRWAKALSWHYTAAYYNRCDLLLSPSAALIAAMRKQGLQIPAEVMPNPVDTDFFRPVAEADKEKLKREFGLRGPSLVYMGRLGYEKSIHLLIDAFAEVLQGRPEAQFMIVGGGPERAGLEDYARSTGARNSMIFTGFLHQEKLAEALQANDVFATASKSENMPISVLEAMAAGLPVVAVRALGLPEIVRDGKNGLLTEADDINDLSVKINVLLEDANLRRRFGEASRRIAEEYSARRSAEFLEKAYVDAIKSKAK